MDHFLTAVIDLKLFNLDIRGIMSKNLSQSWSFMQMIPHELGVFTSNNPTYMDLNHIGLTRMLIIFSHNIKR